MEGDPQFMDGLWMVYGWFGIENQIYKWMIWGQVSGPTPLARVCHPSPSWAGDFMWGKPEFLVTWATI